MKHLLNRRDVPRLAVGLMLAVWTGLDGAHAAEEEGGKDKAANGPVYARLKPISFSVIGPDNKITKEVSILLDLQLTQGKAQQDIEPFTRQIEDAFLVECTEIWDSQPVGAPPVRADRVKARLFKIASGITGPGLIDAVLIQELGERPGR